MDDRAAIAEANRNFYRAMRAQDMRLMEHVWLRADWVGCVHPGGALIVGWRAVRESWLYIMARGAVNVLPTQVTIHVERDLAWVTCIENITVPAEKLWRNTLTQATNLFQRSGDEWRMIHHHASPVSAPGTGPTPLN
jgi:ketosteroid isomerase-like protein